MTPEHQAIFARLMALNVIQEAQIKANPLPYLNMLAEENYKLRQAINDAIFALSGADSYTYAMEEFPKMEPSIVETCLIRNRKASEFLAAAIRQG